jgi:hypothetical protein
VESFLSGRLLTINLVRVCTRSSSNDSLPAHAHQDRASEGYKYANISCVPGDTTAEKRTCSTRMLPSHLNLLAVVENASSQIGNVNLTELKFLALKAY